jgi:hypothetical protein
MSQKPKYAPVFQPREEDKQEVISSFADRMKSVVAEGRAAVATAKPALQRICAAMAQRTDQSYHLRALLYSLWNGQPTSLLEVVSLDRTLRNDFCAVLLAFGFSDGKEEFFYDAVTAELKSSGQFEWFIQEHKESEVKA